MTIASVITGNTDAATKARNSFRVKLARTAEQRVGACADFCVI